MEINNIKTPEDIFLWMDENMQYGWLDSEGSRHVGEMKNFRKQYRTLSVQETLEHKIGTCIEQAEVMHYLLDKINIKNKMFCCRIYEPDDYGNPEDSRLLYQTAGRERKPDDTVLQRSGGDFFQGIQCIY